LEVNHKDPEIGWISEYANKQLSGIAIQKNEEEEFCQGCNIGYKKVDRSKSLIALKAVECNSKC